jgi:anti-sigma factor RsiW
VRLGTAAGRVVGAVFGVVEGARLLLWHLRLRSCVEAYVDGELTGWHRLAVARHVSACWVCGARAETLRLVKHSLRRRGRSRRAPAPAAPPAALPARHELAVRRLRRYARRLAAHPEPGLPESPPA